VNIKAKKMGQGGGKYMYTRVKGQQNGRNWGRKGKSMNVDNATRLVGIYHLY